MPATDFLGSIYTYTWDLAEEGLERSTGRIVELTGCHEVMVALSYHIATYFLPHNPVRPFYHGEDAALYFQPDPKRYTRTRITPRVSEIVKTPDFTERIVDAIRKRGLEFGAWIVYMFNHHLSARYPEFARQDAFGTPYHGQLSPAPDDVREYLVAMTADIVERFRPSAVHVESLCRLHWNYGFLNPKVLSPVTPRDQFLLGLCFNKHSIARASGAKLDGEKLRHDVAEYLRPRLARLPRPTDLEPVTAAWLDEAFDGRLKLYLDAGRKHTTELWMRVAEVIHKGGARLQTIPANLESSWSNDLSPSVNRQVERMTIGPLENGDKGVARVRELSAAMEKGGMVMVSTQPGSMTQPGPLQEQVHTAAALGAKGATFYNYGLLREEQLRFIGTAMRTL
ncbi:MAG TPA: hypothetical protein VG672_00110 [Bryobacteraceae bacterium]|nr:hypothetical protein [Bryobacteraceae bacterium]